MKNVQEKIQNPDASLLAFESPKGTRDRNPNQMRLLEGLIGTITQCFKRHDAVTIDTPVFERKEILTNMYGEDSNLIYHLQDQGGELLALRYDLSVPFARYIAMHKIRTLKRYQIAKVYRGDRPTPTRGRFREFFQCDFDIAGDFGPMLADVECLRIIYEIISELDLGDFIIKVNHRRLLFGLLAICGVPKENLSDVCFVVDKLDKSPWKEVQDELRIEKGLSLETTDRIGQFVKLSGGLDLLESLECDESLSKQSEVKEALEDLRLLFHYCSILGFADRIRFDLSLARAMVYYTGVIYEAVLTGFSCNPENASDNSSTIDEPTSNSLEDNSVKGKETEQLAVGSVAGGGRYDGLVEMFDATGTRVPCVGVSFGIERFLAIREALARSNQSSYGQDVRPTETDVMVVGAHTGLIYERLECCRLLWDAKIKTTMSHKDDPDLMDQLNYCSSTGIPLAVILGASELKRDVVRVRVNKSQSEHEVSYAELVGSLKCMLTALKQNPNT